MLSRPVKQPSAESIDDLYWLLPSIFTGYPACKADTQIPTLQNVPDDSVAMLLKQSGLKIAGAWKRIQERKPFQPVCTPAFEKDRHQRGDRQQLYPGERQTCVLRSDRSHGVQGKEDLFSDGDVLDVAHVTVSAAEPEKTDKASTVLEDEIDAQASASS